MGWFTRRRTAERRALRDALNEALDQAAPDAQAEYEAARTSERAQNRARRRRRAQAGLDVMGEPIDPNREVPKLETKRQVRLTKNPDGSFTVNVDE